MEELRDRPAADPSQPPDVDPAELQLFLRLTAQREQRLRSFRRRRWLFGVTSVLLAGAVIVGYTRLHPVAARPPAAPVAGMASPSTRDVQAPEPPPAPGVTSAEAEPPRVAPAPPAPEPAPARVARAPRRGRDLQDEKRAVAQTWTRTVGHQAARARARKTAQAFMTAARTAETRKDGVAAAEARASAAYWHDVEALVAVPKPQPKSAPASSRGQELAGGRASRRPRAPRLDARRDRAGPPVS